MKSRSTEDKENRCLGSTLQGWLGLFGCWIVIAVVWLVVLPWWAGRPHIQAQMRRLDAQGIDPSAMFYTELEGISHILERTDRVRRDHRESF